MAPLYARILADLHRRIVSGEWGAGSRIPVEHELTRQYQCSRMTVNRALTQLAQARMIERRPGRGSIVTGAHSRSAVIALRDVAEEVAAARHAYSFRIVQRRKSRSTRSQNLSLGLDRAVPLLEIACVHLAGSRPFCYEERLINLQAVPEAAKETFVDTPPGSWLLRSVAWTRAEHRIRAAAADAVVAEALEIRQKRAVLVMERRTTTIAGGAVTFARFAYPAERHELVARFVPLHLMVQPVNSYLDTSFLAAPTHL